MRLQKIDNSHNVYFINIATEFIIGKHIDIKKKACRYFNGEGRLFKINTYKFHSKYKQYYL